MDFIFKIVQLPEEEKHEENIEEEAILPISSKTVEIASASNLFFLEQPTLSMGEVFESSDVTISSKIKSDSQLDAQTVWWSKDNKPLEEAVPAGELGRYEAGFQQMDDSNYEATLSIFDVNSNIDSGDYSVHVTLPGSKQPALDSSQTTLAVIPLEIEEEQIVSHVGKTLQKARTAPAIEAHLLIDLEDISCMVGDDVAFYAVVAYPTVMGTLNADWQKDKGPLEQPTSQPNHFEFVSLTHNELSEFADLFTKEVSTLFNLFSNVYFENLFYESDIFLELQMTTFTA